MAIRAYKFGSMATDTITDVRMMACAPSTADNYMTCEYPVGTDAQVTAGKTFYITKLDYSHAVGDGAFVIGYGNDGVADGAAAPTSWVQLTSWYSTATANLQVSLPVWIPIPATKYPCVLNINGAGLLHITIYGVEITD